MIRSGFLACFLLLLCCLPASDAICQPIENRFTHYTPKDGLPDGYVTDIKQDSAGFLWLSTLNGLCRFDGHTFKTYRNDPNDTTSLCENHLNNIYIDAQNHLWCVSFNCLYLYHPDGEWFEHFYMDGYNVEEISGEENGQLILSCSIKGLWKFDKKNKKLSRFERPGLEITRCYEYLKDKAGTEWMSIGRGLFKYEPKTKTGTSVFKWGGHLLQLPDGNILCGTYGHGLFVVNRATNTIKQFLPAENDPDAIVDDILYRLYQLNDSIVLIGTRKGLSVFNWRKETFTNIVHERTNPASLAESISPVFAIFKDREGILWIGDRNLDRYDFGNFRIETYPARGKERRYGEFAGKLNFFPCTDGRFLLGTGRGMEIYYPERDTVKKIDAKQFNPDARDVFKMIDCIQDDTHGNTWCFSSPNFYSFRIKNNIPENIHEYHFPFGIHLGEMTFDKSGCIYIATWGQGLLKFNPVDSSYVFFDTSARSPARLTNMKIRAICSGHDGSLWVGTQKGIDKIEKDGKTVKLFSQDKKRYGAITDWILTDMKEDTHGKIWFSTTEHGVGRIDPENDSVTFLSMAQGLPTCLYEDICVDDYDCLWVKSKMGILRINTTTLQYQLYTDNEGFPTPGSIIDLHYAGFNRMLYMLTSDAIYEIDPKQINYAPKIPKTLITGFSVLDKERPMTASNTIHLNYNENFINIKFAALLFHSNELIRYAYKMEGIDNDWVYCNYKRNAPYTNLPPGHYVFSVKAESPEGIWNDTPTLLFIIVAPPFWQTWWFYCAEMIAGIVFVFWVVRLYTARKLALQKSEFEKLQAVSYERTRIAADMHDELGAGLTSIRMLSEIAGEKIKQDNTARSEIEKIERSATSLSENLREIIWTMNTRFDKLDDFIVYMRAYAVEYFDNSEVGFQFYAPAVIPQLPMPGELRRNIFLCIKEALNNIIKHAKATDASLTFNVTGNMLVVEVKDNGAGIDTGNGNRFGNGLTGMKERLHKFGSELEIEVNGGTKLVFKINIVTPAAQ